MTNTTATSALSLLAHEEGYDPIEDRLRANIRATIEAVFEEELEGLLESPRVYWRVKLSKDEPHGTEKISPEVHG